MSELKIKVKRNALFTDFQMVSPYLLIVLGYFRLFCENNNLPCVLTSIMDEAEGRVSETHATGRAFDASVRQFSNGDILKCIEFIEHNVGKLGAISASDGKQRVLVYHDAGSGKHFHFQVKR